MDTPPSPPNDANEPRLLDFVQICARHENIIGASMASLYGDCAVATESREYDRSEPMERVMYEFAWEKLNTGHYSMVDDAWRLFYAAVCAIRAVRCARLGDFKTALYTCDMSLMMGAPIGDNVLARFATDLHQRIESSLSDNTNRQLQAEASKNTHQTAKMPDLSRSKLIAIESQPSLDLFCGNYLHRQVPIIISDIVCHWPACTKWTFSYIRKLAGHRTVPIEIGSKYTEDSWSQKLMTVNEFMDRFMSVDQPTEIGYLAQHRLFVQIPDLVNDIIVPDYCLLASESESDVDLNIWLGPANTVSPLHTDPRDNLLCQIVGRKFVRLVPPSDSDKVYANDEGILTNTSQLDAEYYDAKAFALFDSATRLDCVLEPGQMLFIPRRWWHYVRALDDSISVSCWFG